MVESSLMSVCRFLDRKLRIAEFADSSHNGLQVASSGSVRRICCGVDASLEFFRQARRRGANLLICHHGLSWGDSLKRITGLNYRRVEFLIRNDMALYACHLPLDAHATLGNNALICRALGLRRLRRFGDYHGADLGFEGELARPEPYAAFRRRVQRVTRSEMQTADFGRKTVRRIAVVSGRAPDLLDEAGRKGIDVYVTGEPALDAYVLAQEYGINAIFAGHYATETFGVRAVGNLLRKRFGIPAELVDLRVPY